MKEMKRKMLAMALAVTMMTTGIPCSAAFADEAEPAAEAPAAEQHEAAKSEAPKTESSAPAETKTESSAKENASSEAGNETAKNESAEARTEESSAPAESSSGTQEAAKSEQADTAKNEEADAPKSEEAASAGEAESTENEAKAGSAEAGTEEQAAGEAQNAAPVLKAPKSLMKAISSQMKEEKGDFEVEYDNTAYEVSFDEAKKTVTVKSLDENNSKEITVRMKDGKTSTDQMIVLTGTTIVILEAVNIAAALGSAVTLDQAAKTNAEIIIDGDVSLKGKNGIEIAEGTEATITGKGGKEGTDSLTAVATGGQKHGVGIGYFNAGGKDAGTINITDIAKVYAEGSSNSSEGGAGIGGGRFNSEKNGIINISDVKELTAIGSGKKAAGIGAGYHNGVTINIARVDKLSAKGGEAAAAIGTSSNTVEVMWNGNKNNYIESRKVIADSSITITDSNVTAVGGKNGAAIGTGYSDKSYGDYSRIADGNHTGYNHNTPDIFITIDGNSTVTATGGKNAAAIGGGYKDYGPTIRIGAGTTVTAYAGEKESGGVKVPTAIGSGADGSGIFTDGRGTIKVEEGANVVAFGYGYDTPKKSGENSEVLGSKWAISRELDGSQSSAAIFNGRILKGSEYERTGKFYEGDDLFTSALQYKDTEDHIIYLKNLSTGKEYAIPMISRYSSFAVSLEPGTYSMAIDDDEASWSYLASEGYQAATNGTAEGATTGNNLLVYGNENVSEGSYADYQYTYWTYKKGSSDQATVHYAFGAPSANFTVGKGVNNFDAIAYRETVTPVLPVIEDDPEEPAEDPQVPQNETETPQDETGTPVSPVTPVIPQNGPAAEVPAAIGTQTAVIPAAAPAGNAAAATAAAPAAATGTAAARTAAAANTGNAAAPAAQTAAIDENAAPLADIDNSDVPMSTSTPFWALLNLILAVLTAIISLVLAIRYFGRKRSEEEEQEEAEEKTIRRKGAARLAGLAIAVIGIILFILTEDMTLPMQWTDQWTLWMAVIFLAELAAAALSRKTEKEDEAQTEAA